MTFDNFESLTDHELAISFRSGDESSFNLLHERYYQGIYHRISSLTNPFDAQDLTQEVFLKVAKRINSYKGPNFPSWIKTIADNQVKDFFRFKSSRLKESDRIDFGDLPYDSLRSNSSPYFDATITEAREALLTSALTDFECHAVGMFLDGFSRVDVARSVGRSKTTMTRWLSAYDERVRRQYENL